MTEGTAGLALVCRPDGVITEIVRDDLQSGLQPGASFYDLAEGVGRDKCLLFMAEIEQQGAAYDWELHLRTRDGYRSMHFAGGRRDDLILLLGTCDPTTVGNLYDDLVSINNEHVNQLRALMKDQFLQRQQETRAEASIYDDLTRLNNELTATQRELTKKNVQLEQLNQQKNQLLGMAAHDLRMPLGVIETYSDFLLQDVADRLDGESREFLESIKSSSQFMLHMVNDLLDISKIEAGELTLEITRTNLAQLVEKSVSVHQLFASRKSIDLHLTIGQKVEPIDVDAYKMDQVLNNLLSNALKYSSAGSSVQVRLQARGENLVLSVTDEGQGIAADEMDRLFQPFKRTSAKTTAGETSTGLGLAICRRIVEGHEGKIWAESILGAGTTFYVSLPCLSVSANQQDASERSGAGEKSLRILVAEDNPVGRRILSILLTRLGHTCTLTENGQEALEAAERDLFDVVLMDVEMPVMDGIQATQALNSARPDLPVVGLTAHSSALERDRCLAAGMVEVVTKPIRRPTLKAALLRAVAG